MGTGKFGSTEDFQEILIITEKRDDGNLVESGGRDGWILDPCGKIRSFLD